MMINHFKAVALATAVLLALPASAQKKSKDKEKSVEGKFTYSLEVDDANLPPEAVSMFQGAEMVILRGDGKVRTEVKTPMSTNITITDEATNSAWMMVDAMGNKFKYKAEQEDLEKSKEEPLPEITYIDGEKTIAGYACKKATIKFPGSESTTYVYYTEELPNGSMQNFKGLKGFPLEFELNQGIHMIATAKSVELGKQDAAVFVIPSDYPEVTKEELQQMMGGGK